MINLRTLSDGELANEAERVYPNIPREMSYELIYRVRRAAGKTLEPSSARGERIGGIDPAPITINADMTTMEARVYASMNDIFGAPTQQDVPTVTGRFPHARK